MAEQKKWIQNAIKNPGALTRQAKAADMSTSEFTNKVLANKDKYNTTTVRRAALGRTLGSFRK